MGTKRVKPPVLKKARFAPQNSLFFVSDNKVGKLTPIAITPAVVGKKAYGLSCLPPAWGLPFIVLSGNLSPRYRRASPPERPNIIAGWLKNILGALSEIGISQGDGPIIVRSSGQSEGMSERGKYYSVPGTLGNLGQTLATCLDKLATDPDLDGQEIPLLIQEHITPTSSKGHLSNERRVYEEARDWLGEFQEQKTPFKINLRKWRKNTSIKGHLGKKLSCNLSAHIPETLRIPATWAYDSALRIHYEWVWDGRSVYIVQADEEDEVKGVDPSKIDRPKLAVSSSFSPKCIKKITQSHAARFHKISNVFIYRELGQPTTDFFVLDDQSVIDGLARGQASSDLESDMMELVKGSLVIRTDMDTADLKQRQLLPRTEEVRDFETAMTWLKQNSSKIKSDGAKHDIAFIFHNFVPAAASAFAYAAPGERKVQIESLWGLPEGLYYYAHDKYIVDTKTSNPGALKSHRSSFQVTCKPHYKRSFVDPDETGKWAVKTLKPPYDWRKILQREDWVKDIALESRRIAEKVGKPLSIMWLIDVDSKRFLRPIAPWYHEIYELKKVSRTMMQRTKTAFDSTLDIKTSADILELEKESAKDSSHVRYVRIQPQEEQLLRDKKTLHRIGELCHKINAVISLEGGVLSHAYYQLMQTDAQVEVLHPFSEDEDKHEFNKLVRDKVPQNIESGGEAVTKARLSDESLLRALREKLVEEAFEALDAIDRDAILGEMADVNEVIDAILLRINATPEELKERQKKKRDKAGGFKDGVVLLDTKSPLPTTKSGGTDRALFKDLDSNGGNISSAANQLILERGHRIGKWSDRRDHESSTEALLRLFIPIVRDHWMEKTLETPVDSEKGSSILAEIRGTREGSRLRIELSMFMTQKQLNLFNPKKPV